MNEDPYRLLARRLDALPNGFPPAADGAELRLLAKLFTPEEAALASTLRLTLETPAEIAGRTGGEMKAVEVQLKSMARRGLIKAGRSSAGLGFGLMPFVVGFYEMQGSTMDAEFARLFEDYYHEAFVQTVTVAPQVHRVIPVNQTVRMDTEVRPYESAAEIISACRSWGVTDCICRKQKALIGEPCGHPLGVCMAMSQKSGAFDSVPFIRSLTQDEAMAILRRAAEAGLVHTVSNSQEGLWYICNCCTCGCAILRGMADLGIANVIARSAFVNQVDAVACLACGLCVEQCQFAALTLDDVARVDRGRCVGCGVCVPTCPEDALGLVRRPEAEVLAPPVTDADWRVARAAARGLDLERVL
jgi:Na+-translocating ferredoxin:NAD+ oxidoreductase subunit B